MKLNKIKWVLWILMMSPAIPIYQQTTKAIDPYDTGLELTATWMVVCLTIALLTGPIGRLLKQPQAFFAKQPAGIAAFSWSILHILVYFFYNQSQFIHALTDIILKPSVLIGGVSFIILLKMALTSFKGAIKALGKRWNVLHSLGVIAVALGFAHGISFQKTTSTDGAIISMFLLMIVVIRYSLQLWKTKK